MLALAAITGFSFRVSADEWPIYRKKDLGDTKKIALTFDDGPDPKLTPEILSILDEYGIKATFFVVGENVEAHPETLEAEVEAGHEIGNHTFTHCRIKNSDSKTLFNEVNACTEAIERYSDVSPKVFRPPEGVVNPTICRLAEALDYKIIIWDIDTLDWRHTPPEKIAENVLTHAHGGDIILMHDYICKDSPTPAALRLFLPKLIEQGYQFVTVSELLGTGETPTNE